MLKKKNSTVWNCFILALYGILYLVITCFHEPWFDEAQAWQIGKSAGYYDILFTIPHYEGHPPLWSLLLSIPAKLGVPYEIGLKGIGFLISFISVYILLFHSPFPDLIRYCIPFSYFLFYQYGIVVRSYALMLLLFLLLAVCYLERHKKPYLYVSVMTLLCLTSAYGIAISGGLSIAFLWEILEEKQLKNFLRDLLRDNRTRCLLLLLVMAVLILVEIFPVSNALGLTTARKNPIWLCCLIIMFTAIPDTLIIQSDWYENDKFILKDVPISVSTIVPVFLVGIAVWFMIWCFSSKKTFRLYCISYFCYVLFGGIVYYTLHHEGIAFLHLIFWAWITCLDEERGYGWKRISQKLVDRDRTLCKKVVVIFCFACIGMNFYWTTASSYYDIRNNYYASRDFASIIKEKHFDQLCTMTAWQSDEDVGESKDDTCENNPYAIGTSVAILAYFDHNFIENLNMGRDTEMFEWNRTVTNSEYQNILDEWKKLEYPEFLIGEADVGAIYGYSDKKEFWAVERVRSVDIWKNNINRNVQYLYLRDDLMDQYGYERVDLYQEDLIESFIGHELYEEIMANASKNNE